VNLKRSLRKRRETIRRLWGKARGKRIVHHLHIGKTGGTSLKEVLNRCPSTPCCEIFTHEHGVHLSHIPPGEKVVFFLRDPISRFVSGFYGRQREDRPRYYAPWSEGEARAFARFPTANELAEGLDSEDPSLREAAEDAMRSIAHVRKPMWEWIGDEEYFLERIDDVLFVGFQEQYDEEFERLRKLLGIPKKYAPPKDEVRSHRNPTNIDRHLSDRAVHNLRQWYRRDYELMEFIRREIRNRGIGRMEQRT